jgi:hypothetical protein
MRDDKDVMIIVSSWQSRDLVQANWLAVVNAFPTTLSCILYLSKLKHIVGIFLTVYQDCIPTIINPHSCLTEAKGFSKLIHVFVRFLT